jgi:hypothetical protein
MLFSPSDRKLRNISAARPKTCRVIIYTTGQECYRNGRVGVMERNNFLFQGIQPDRNSWMARLKSDFLLLIHRTKDTLHHFINSFLNTF